MHRLPGLLDQMVISHQLGPILEFFSFLNDSVIL